MSTSINKPLNFRNSNSLITTKKYIGPPKLATKMSFIPGSRRPLCNGANTPFNENDYTSPFGTARPLKHYRKQLDKNVISNNGKIFNSGHSASSVTQVNIPGGTVYRDSDLNCVNGEQSEYITSEKFNYVNQNVNQNKKIQNNGSIKIGDSYEIQTGIYETKCLGCNPETKVIKRAVTKLSKSYYTDTKAYLKSRCLTYDQKNSVNKRNDVKYVNEDGVALYPTDSPNGPQTFLPNNCPKSHGGKCVVTNIYKPNNAQFSQQGAVSSSLRTLAKTVNTITVNGASFRNAFGAQAANAGKYQGSIGAPPYFVKSNYQKPVTFRRNGRKNTCNGVC